MKKFFVLAILILGFTGLASAQQDPRTGDIDHGHMCIANGKTVTDTFCQNALLTEQELRIEAQPDDITTDATGTITTNRFTTTFDSIQSVGSFDPGPVVFSNTSVLTFGSTGLLTDASCAAIYGRRVGNTCQLTIKFSGMQAHCRLTRKPKVGTQLVCSIPMAPKKTVKLHF